MSFSPEEAPERTKQLGSSCDFQKQLFDILPLIVQTSQEP